MPKIALIKCNWNYCEEHDNYMIKNIIDASSWVEVSDEQLKLLSSEYAKRYFGGDISLFVLEDVTKELNNILPKIELDLKNAQEKYERKKQIEHKKYLKKKEAQEKRKIEKAKKLLQQQGLIVVQDKNNE